MGPITIIEELFQHYREIVVLDTEYISNPGERLFRCAVAYELRSGRKHKFWAYGKGIRKRNLLD